MSVVFVALAARGSEGDSIVLTDADSTSEIHLQAGEQFEVRAPGEEVFVFEAIGDADLLRLEYIRSFDDPVIPERVVEYIIRVDDAPWPPEGLDPPSTSGATAPIEVGELVAGFAPTDATVVGYVVIDDAGARLCEVLAESFPPQCGGAEIVIANPEMLVVDLEQE